MSCSIAKAVSLRQIAVLGGMQAKTTVAKQSIWKRLNSQASKLLEAVLGEQLHAGKIPTRLLGTVRRILVSDSTTLGMHQSLHKAFPGASNQNSTTPQACARLQVTMDLLRGRFLHFGLSGFRRNDQAASMDVLDVLKPGDLLLRDLGYFTLRSLAAIAQHGAFFLSRLRYNTGLFGANGETLNLVKRLRKAAKQGRKKVVFEAQLGKRERLPVTVVALRLSKELAAERRRKAREDRDRRLNHDSAYYELLGWSILITNLPAKEVSEINLRELYALRWRIENVFKAWKGGLRPGDFSEHRSNQWHLRCLLLGQMIALSELGLRGLFDVKATRQGNKFSKASGNGPSLFKTLDVLLLCGALHLEKPNPELLRLQLEYHGQYETRNRINLPQIASRLGHS